MRLRSRALPPSEGKLGEGRDCRPQGRSAGGGWGVRQGLREEVGEPGERPGQKARSLREKGCLVVYGGA